MDYSGGPSSHRKAQRMLLIIFQSWDFKMARLVPDSKGWRLNWWLVSHAAANIQHYEEKTKCYGRRIWGRLLCTIIPTFILVPLIDSAWHPESSEEHNSETLWTYLTDSFNFYVCISTIAIREFARKLHCSDKRLILSALENEKKCLVQGWKWMGRSTWSLQGVGLSRGHIHSKRETESQNKLGHRLLFCIWRLPRRLLLKPRSSPRGMELSVLTRSFVYRCMRRWSIRPLNSLRLRHSVNLGTHGIHHPQSTNCHIWLQPLLSWVRCWGDQWGHNWQAKPPHLSAPHFYLFCAFT